MCGRRLAERLFVPRCTSLWRMLTSLMLTSVWLLLLWLLYLLWICSSCAVLLVFSPFPPPPPFPQFSTIRRTVSRVVFLHDGILRWDGPVSELDTTDNPYVRQYFDASLSGPMQFPDDGDFQQPASGLEAGASAEEGGNGVVVAHQNGVPPQ